MSSSEDASELPPRAADLFAVRKAIKDDEQRVLLNWPVLRNQDAVGAAIFGVSIAAMSSAFAAYVRK
jgi:hypothetical protein